MALALPSWVYFSLAWYHCEQAWLPNFFSRLREGLKALSKILRRLFQSSSLLFLNLSLILWVMVRTPFSRRIDGWGTLFVLFINICIIFPRSKTILSRSFWWDLRILCIYRSSFVVTWLIGDTHVFRFLILAKNFLVNLFFGLLVDLAPLRSRSLMWFGGLRFQRKLGSLSGRSCLVGLTLLIGLSKGGLLCCLLC